MARKYLLLLTVFFFSVASAQSNDEWVKYMQALLRGDTVLAAKIEKENITVEPIEEKPFQKRNVAEHVFHFSINRLKDTIISLFNFKNQSDNKILKPVFYNYMTEGDTSVENRLQITFNAETKKDALFGMEYFSRPEAANDVYIHDFGQTWFSKLYFSKGRPLETRMAFIIKLSAQDATTTKVTIVPERPAVLNGISGFGVHAAIARETEVRPSTIEEYSLLLFVADILGDKSLAPLRTPENE